MLNFIVSSKLVFLFFLSPTLFAAGANSLGSGKITLKDDPALVEKAKGIRVLFLSLYDSSQKPPAMPYAALKIDLKGDAKGELASFDLNPQTLRILSAGEAPAVLDLKAKLDKDGSAGRDAAGDLVGWKRGVKRGTPNLSIQIDSSTF